MLKLIRSMEHIIFSKFEAEQNIEMEIETDGFPICESCILEPNFNGMYICQTCLINLCILHYQNHIRIYPNHKYTKLLIIN